MVEFCYSHAGCGVTLRRRWVQTVCMSLLTLLLLILSFGALLICLCYWPSAVPNNNPRRVQGATAGVERGPTSALYYIARHMWYNCPLPEAQVFLYIEVLCWFTRVSLLLAPAG